ncbi:MAG: PKD domain-containing protein [Nitrosopumilus sp.]|uniref:PKD domain-containing protein n=1 Tax=Nitrosopumilus sp. TaxID=2024843 RepID=UPI00247113B5|nr:peptidase [Nitrosopumilus sp.]MDH5431619.1 PKD domain-containing protein [Nitrosopumilus sp.]
MNLYFLLPLILGVIAIGSFSNSFAEIESVDVDENKLVTLIGEGYDADTSNLSFKWTQIYGDPVKLSSTTVPEPTFMAPDVKNGEIKVLTFELVVTDPQGASSSDVVEVIVNSVNNPPTVNAGHDLYAIQSINAISIIPQVVDKDGDVLTYKWEQLAGQEVYLSSSAKKHLTLQPVMFDYSQTDPLTFRITVDDGFGGVASDTVNVILYTSQIQNAAISIEAGPIQTVTEGQTVSLDVIGHTLNDKPIRYTWIQVLGTPVTLSSFSGDHIEFTAPDVGDIEEIMSFHVTGYSQGNGYANDMAIVKVLPSNHAPIADAGDDRDVPQRTFVGFEGSATDADNDNLRYMWAQKSGIPTEIYEKTQPSAYIFTPTTTSLSEPLVFELTVTDPQGNSDTDDVKITVTTLNSPPRAYAGADQRVHGGDNVSISGTAFDLNSESLKIQWKQIFGESVSFDKSNLKFSFTAPEVGPLDSKRLAFELTVTDPQGLSDSDQVVIFVSPENSAPKANAGADITVDENTVANINCIGTDPDRGALYYSWSTTSKATIEQPANSKTMVKIPNVVRDSTMTFTCSVSDGTYSASDSMNILVRNVFSADIISDAGLDRIVNENVKISLDGSKSHDPENQELYFQWTQLSGEKVKLSSKTSMSPSFTSPIVKNDEIKVLTFELKVFDDNGRESTDTVVITVDPVNSPPEASASARQ